MKDIPEIPLIEPIPEHLLDQIDPSFWEEMTARIVESIGMKLDEEIERLAVQAREEGRDDHSA